MYETAEDESEGAGVMTSQKPLRLWPGVAAVVLQWLIWYGVPIVVPETALYSLGAGAVCALAIVLWWLFFSRAPWLDRVSPFVLMIVGLIATKRLVHPSIAGAGMGMLLYIMAIPVLSLALVFWAVTSRRLSPLSRRASMVAAVAIACGAFTVIRTGGIVGGGGSDLHWRWTPSPEERLLAQTSDEPKAQPPAPAAAEIPGKAPTANASDVPLDLARGGPASAPAGPVTAKTESTSAATETPIEWPGFRGPERDDIIRGVRIKTDWSASPPVEMWRRPIGPGWSSFAVHGDLLYTQEQRGEDELVSAYKVRTGDPVWRHRDKARFWESNGGAGPRATPTLSRGRVYTFGATGILNALDARTGAVVWSRDVATETHTEVPGWGFASSPLVVDDVVVVAADATLVGYDVATGHRRWTGPTHRGSYSSPHRTTIAGVEQILLLGGAGVQSVAPSSGAVLWEHAWRGVAIVQPALLPDGNILVNTIATTGGLGTRRLAIAHGPGGWAVEERWTSNGLKPYFNDFVVHKGHAFGFDGSILACIDLGDGARKWKGGRYGNGQLVLLPDQDVLLVLSEEGELVLVAATGDEFRELARFPVLNGKTWNHPVLVGDVLLVRNGEEMAAFRLSLAGRSN